MERYGGHPTTNKQVREKFKQTCLARYGTNYPNQSHMKQIIHLINDYNWMFNQYVECKKSPSIIANELGINKTTVLNYLHYHNIEIISRYGFSLICIHWLDSIREQEGINIQHALNGGEYQIPGTKFSADGYCHETNTIYEFHGDIFHGNPMVFNSDEKCHPWSELTAGELYQKTIEREAEIRSMGYKLIVMWESEYNNI